MNMHTEPGSRVDQHGVALFMALVFLLVITLLGVYGMNISHMENRMAGNSQIQVTVLGNAELALAAGERQIENMPDKLPFMDWNAPGDAYYDRSDVSARRIDVLSPDWDFTYHAVNATSRYVIEYAGTETVPGNDTSVDDTAACPAGSCVWVFLVTAQADAGRGARRTVQSVYMTTGLADSDAGIPVDAPDLSNLDIETHGPNFMTGRRAWIDLQP